MQKGRHAETWTSHECRRAWDGALEGSKSGGREGMLGDMIDGDGRAAAAVTQPNRRLLCDLGPPRSS